MDYERGRGYGCPGCGASAMSRPDSFTNAMRGLLDPEAAAIEAYVVSLEADAARYRWLRDDNGYWPEENHVEGGEELDERIDAILAGGAR